MSRPLPASLAVSSIAVAAAIGVEAVAEAPEAGFEIENIASVSYFNTALGLTESVTTNTVRTIVNAVEDFNVTPDQTYIRSPGESAEFLFVIENTGNVDTSVVLNFGDFEGTYSFSNVSAFIDSNNNGVVDPGEPALTPDMVLSLPQGVHQGVIVLVDVPETATAGDRALGALSGVLESQFLASQIAKSLPRSAVGEVLVEDNTLDLRKKVTESDDGGLTYTLTFRNNASLPLEPGELFDGPMILDGVGEELILVRDFIPLNTEFVSVIDAVDFEAVYHLAGEAEEVWTRIQPDDLSAIDQIGFITTKAMAAGSSRDFSFAVSVVGMGSELVIDNIAEAVVPGEDGVPSTLSSNLVSTTLTGPSGRVGFFGSDEFASEISQIGFGDDVYLQVESGLCNVSQDIDQAVITVTTTPDGDSETVIAIETAPNSSVFRSAALPTAEAPPILIGDGILQGRRRSTASATIDCDSDARSALALSPAGAVFLSVTNEPVPGAIVELIGPNGAVLDTVTTNAEGVFEVTPEGAGAHTIRVTPPQGLIAPSIRTSFDGYGRVIDTAASYGAPFTVARSDMGGALNIDVPVDPDLTGALVAEKSGNRRSARIGDVVEYTVDIRNTAPVAVQNSEIVDQLPRGVSFVPGSALLNGEALSDPENASGQQLVFPIDLLTPNGEAELVYSVTVDASVSEGDLTNLAFATGTLVGFGEDVQSNIASHTLDIDNSGGVFSRDGVILGKLFMDCNTDGLQQNENGQEPGIPGVMMHTQTGLSVVTDQDGNYSLAGLDPKTHVIDIYEPSLPPETRVRNTRTMDAFAPGSRFVPLRAGEIRTEDFAVEACTETTLADVLARIEAATMRIDGIAEPSGAMSFEGNAGVRRIDHSSQAKGVVISDSQAVLSGDLTTKVIQPVVDLKEVLSELGSELSFVDLSDGDNLVHRTANIRVSGPSGVELKLVHNGVGVSGDRLGRRASDNGIQVLEFIALDLLAGENTFSLTALDGFGNVRGEKTISVTAPGRPAGIKLSAPATAPADPTRPVPLVIQVVDAEGRPAASTAEVTLVPGDDTFDARDVSEQVPGQQVFVTNGRAEIGLVPSGRVGTRTIRVSSPLGDAETNIRFVANIDSADIAVGYVEGALNLNDPEVLSGYMGADDISPFEDTEEGIEANFYLKGEVFEDTLLTLRYETDRDIEDELFRSDEPDEFYPVYGDRSTRGYDAQSSGAGFAMLERGTSYLMFGDVSNEAEASALQLGRFQRALEGGRAHIETGNLRIDGYYGKTATGQEIVEIPARGVSGPYDLGFGDVTRNSELVELITRDREQPDVIIKTERLSRFSSYTLDYFARTLIFTRPVPSRDEDLNPISIRVTFETERGAGESYDVYGAEAAFDLTDWMTVGARQLTSDGPAGTDDKRMVRAAYADVAVGENGNLQLEIANTENGDGQTGDAARLSFEQSTEHGNYGARIAVSDETFDAPGASISSGREEARLHASRRFGKSAILSGEAIYSAAKQQGTERMGVVGRYESELNTQLRVRAGSRFVTENRENGASEDAVTVIGGLVWTPEFMKGGAIDLEAEQEVTDGSASRFAVGADYAISPKWRLYAQGEYSGSRSGQFGLTDNFNENVTFRAGSEYRFSENVTAFSEYRANESFFDAGVAQGLTANWAINPALSTRVRVEHVQPIGDAFPRNTAAGLGFTLEPEEGNWIVDSDFDFSAGENGRQTWYASTTMGRQWYDVTFLARNRFAVSDSGEETRTRDRLRMGWAHRPRRDNAFNTLVWYEYALDNTEQSRENRHIWSAGGERKPNFDDHRMRLRARLAGQYYSFTGGPANIDVDEVSLLAQAGIDRDFGKRWNLGANLSAITDGDFADQTFGVGAEVNFNLKKNAMIGLGYNHAEVKRESLEGLYRTGVFVRLRMKFDQSLWNIFDEEN